MKITRRAVLRISGLAAASLALTGCRAAGSAALGGSFTDWWKKTLGYGSAASSEAASSAAASAASGEAAASSAASEAAASSTVEEAASSTVSLPVYDADPLTGEAKRSGGASWA